MPWMGKTEADLLRHFRGPPPYEDHSPICATRASALLRVANGCSWKIEIPGIATFGILPPRRKSHSPLLEDLVCSCCFLLSSPSNPQLYVLVVDYGEDTIGYYNPGEDTFKRHKVEPDISCATMFKGQIFLLMKYEELAIVGIENSELRVRALRNKDINWSNPGGISVLRDYLISSGEDLLVVQEMIFALPMGQIYGFKVFWMNFAEGTWEELKSIGDRAIFLTTCGGISCSPKDSRVKKNAIYLVENGNSHIRVYDLEDQSISKVSPYSNVDYRSSHSEWIML